MVGYVPGFPPCWTLSSSGTWKVSLEMLLYKSFESKCVSLLQSSSQVMVLISILEAQRSPCKQENLSDFV